MPTPRARAEAFCQRFSLRVPILMAPMAGSCPPALAIAVASAGGMGAGGMLGRPPEAIADWAREVRAGTNGAFQLNLWIPDPPPRRDAVHEAEIRAFLGRFGPEVPAEAGDPTLPDFAAQCEALLAAGPAVISSIMGLYPPEFVARFKARGIVWFATVTTVAEALAAEAAGADVIVAQGAEAGGHRGAFDATMAERQAVGLFALLPAVVDAVKLPVVATGGIADGRGVAAALLLGASAAQIGSGLLRTPEAGVDPLWAAALGTTRPEDTMYTRAFSGRPNRAIVNAYVRAAAEGPEPAPYPVQRGLTAPMRMAAAKARDFEHMQALAGQAAWLGRAEPAAAAIRRIWDDASRLLG